MDIDKKTRPKLLIPDEAIRSFAGLTDSKSGCKRYFEYLEILADDESGQRELELSNLSKGWCKGEKKFIKAHFKNLKEKELALVTARQQGVRWGELEEIRELVWDQ